MSAQVLDGKACGVEVEAEVKAKVSVLNERGITPHLAVVIVGGMIVSTLFTLILLPSLLRIGEENSFVR